MSRVMAYRRGGSQGPASLTFYDHKSDEEPGQCRLLDKDGKEIALCEEKLRNRKHYYCRNCYHVIASEFGVKATKEWPPKRDGSESRYCYDHRTENLFLVPKKWMEIYDNTSSNDGAAIEIKYRKHHSKKGGNYPCYVYVIRLQDGMIYIGQTKDIKRRIHQHKNSPGKTIQKHGGYKHKIKEVKVNNRETAEALEEFLVQVFRDCSIRATHGFEADD